MQTAHIYAWLWLGSGSKCSRDTKLIGRCHAYICGDCGCLDMHMAIVTVIDQGSEACWLRFEFEGGTSIISESHQPASFSGCGTVGAFNNNSEDVGESMVVCGKRKVAIRWPLNLKQRC